MKKLIKTLGGGSITAIVISVLSRIIIYIADSEPSYTSFSITSFISCVGFIAGVMYILHTEE